MAKPSSAPPSTEAFEVIVGETPPMKEVRRLAAHATSRGLDVLVYGEPGTGKEVVARAIHMAGGGPKSPFLRVEAGASPGELDTKLFGPKLAQSTIYLREVGQLARSQQPHLRHELEERDQVGHAASAGGKPRFSNVRLVCGSTYELEGPTQKDPFDAALLRRLSQCVIRLPPLRSRREDIPLLVDHFLGILKRDLGHQVDSFSPGAIGALIQRSWPGNVRELYEHVRTTVILSPTRVIEATDLWPRPGQEQGTEPWHLGYRELRKRVLLRFESDFVARVLKTAGGNVSLAARLAKIDRKHLWRLIQRTGIKLERFDR